MQLYTIYSIENKISIFKYASHFPILKNSLRILYVRRACALDDAIHDVTRVT